MISQGQRPLVSIVVATYNRAHYLSQAIDSCLAMNYRDIEVVVVDDGSTDNTRELCTSYNDRRIRYIFKSNGGCSLARNLGVASSKGKYIKFLDSDDLLMPDKLEEEIRRLEETGADFCVSDSYEFYFNPEWRVLSRSIASLDHTMKNFPVDLFMTFRNRNCTVLYSGKIFDTLRFREDLYFNEDSEFLLRVAILYRGAYLPMPTAIVRNHDENKSRLRSRKVDVAAAQMQSLKEVYERHKEFAREARIREVPGKNAGHGGSNGG